MRTRKSTITFQHPFTLRGDVGALPAASYDIEIDEEEIDAANRTAYRRTAIYFYVHKAGSTRTILVTPADFDSALQRDLQPTSANADASRG